MDTWRNKPLSLSPSPPLPPNTSTPDHHSPLPGGTILTAQAAAAALAALDPNPLPSGSPLCNVRFTPLDFTPSSSSVAAAATPTQLSSAFRVNLPPSPVISTKRTLPPGTESEIWGPTRRVEGGM